jgi:Na+:H+ antiporter, NhaA family
LAVRLKTIQPAVFQRFFRTETVGGSVLLLFGMAAVVLANSPLASTYEHLWQTPIPLGSFTPTLHQWIMAD